MQTGYIFTKPEKELSLSYFNELKIQLSPDDELHLRTLLRRAVTEDRIERNVFGLNPVLLALQTARIAVNEIGLKRDSILAILLYDGVLNGYNSIETVEVEFGEGTAKIIRGLVRVQNLYKKNPVVESENFRNLLLSFAEDMRVILIMIADRVNLMRQIRNTSDTDSQHKVAEEASYLYAPLAHKLGLYQLKSELEDLSLKYLEHDAYYMIKDKLNETKSAREAYISQFIEPVKQRLESAGLRFHIKGRTKSIHSIWQKMKKQRFARRERKDAMLAGLFYSDRHVSTQSETVARLALRAEIKRI